LSGIEPREDYVTVNGIRLHYLDWGGAGEPIVIVHATGFLGRVYEPIARELTRIGHVFAYDQRGHGDSGAAPDGVYNWPATLADLRGFINAMGFQKIRGFGHSAGATALGGLAAVEPERLSRAVLIDPVVHDTADRELLNQRRQWLVETTLKRRRIFDSIDHAMEHLGSKPPFDTWDRNVLRLYCLYGMRETADGKRELKCAPEVEAKLYDGAPDFDGLSLILKAKRPLLIVLTRQAHELRAAAVKRLKSEARSAEILDLSEENHLMPMEKPQEVAHIALQFLTRD